MAKTAVGKTRCNASADQTAILSSGGLRLIDTRIDSRKDNYVNSTG